MVTEHVPNHFGERFSALIVTMMGGVSCMNSDDDTAAATAARLTGSWLTDTRFINGNRAGGVPMSWNQYRLYAISALQLMIEEMERQNELEKPS